MKLAQLRIRTEFSFRQAFGPLPRVASALEATGCPAAGIVDDSTWGHVRWGAALAAVGVKPLFGTTVAVPSPDGARRPLAWALARETRAFYRFSTAARLPGADVQALFRAGGGAAVRFAGAALTDPEDFDYIDINPGSPVMTARALALAKKTGKPLVVTSDNLYPTPADKAAFQAMGGRERTTPQHILSLDELRIALPELSKAQFNRAIENNLAVAEACASVLPAAPLIKVKGDFRKMVEAGRKSRLARGHLPGWPPEYAARLKREILAIEAKEYQSYFLVVADLVQWAKKHMLVGPGRGSSAGSLLCYLVGITEVDPIPHGLLFERFIDLTRKDLPDIDIDFNDNKREMVFKYLAEKYGAANVSRIGNISTLQARSVLAEACKRLGIPDREKFDLFNVLIEHSSGDARYGKGVEDTLTETEVGRSFARRYPESAIITNLENHSWHTSVHAAGVIVSNEAVSDYCTVVDGVAQIDKPDAEKLNLLKIDALGLRTLGIIEDAGVVTPEELYSLKLDDPKVMDIFNAHRYSSIFQFEGFSQRRVASLVHIDSFRTIDHITALARPGPLGGGATDKYVLRKAGKQEIEAAHPLIAKMLEDTYGVVLYQEQVMKIVREIGKFSWEDTTVIRKSMSGSKGVEFFNRYEEQFVKGAAGDDISDGTARIIWREICAFGAWGMNRAHTCSYAVISYWCAWMKVYHPLEFAAACLRGAKDDDGAVSVLREMATEHIGYIPFDIERSAEDWSVIDGHLVGGWKNLVGIGPAKAKAALEARAGGKLDRAKYAKHEVKFSELYPLKTRYADLIANPEKYGCREGSQVVTADLFPESGDVLYIGRLIEKRQNDSNEGRRVQKRGGKLLKGPTLFVDLILKDDSGMVFMFRIGRFDFMPLGKIAFENLKEGDDLLVRARRIANYHFAVIERLKCLNRPEALDGA